jgi:hypothetical protein
MDDEVKSRLEALDLRVTATEKRFDDVKWYIGGASLIFSALALLLGWNFTGERNALRDDVRSMKADLTSAQTMLREDEKDRLANAISSMRELEDRLKEQFGQAVSPQVQLLDPEGKPLAGSKLVAQVTKESDGAARLHLRFALKNTGSGTSGPIWLKFYTQKDLRLFDQSLDDPLYPTEARVEPGDLRPGNLPGKYQLIYAVDFRLPNPSPGDHQVLAKAFYGNGLVSEAPFSLQLK